MNAPHGPTPKPDRRGRCRAWTIISLWSAVLLAAGSPTAAQTVTTAPDSTHAGDQVFRRSDLRDGLAFAAVGAALLPLDTRITNLARRNPPTAATERVLGVVNHAAFPGAYVLGYAVYGLGVVAERESLARIGLYTATSVIVSSHITDLLKGEFGRARPWAAQTSAHFAQNRGFSDGNWTSFPSGHATVAFAAATAFVDGSRLAWPNEPGFVAPVAYGAAAAVAVGRVYGTAHWASDVVAGAAVGTFTARFIVRTANAHPGNWLEKVAVHGVLGLDERGRAALGWSSCVK
jgi:membrane-associated phospholipid phosphatase